MKTRLVPTPINYRKPLPAGLRHDPQVIKWSKRMLGDRYGRPRDLTDEQLAWLYLEVMKRRPEFSPVQGDLYLKAMAETTPILATPELERDKLADDLGLILGQPEIVDFWNEWDGKRGASGPPPDYHTAKSLLLFMASSGISAHADDAHAELTQDERLWTVFEALAGAKKKPSTYQDALKKAPRLGCQMLAVKTNIEMVKALAELRPGEGVGERLLIDGMPVPAWCKQTARGKTAQQEAYRRRICPEAGARLIIRSANGKRDAGANEKIGKFIRSGDFWRGYYLVVISDQATGVPLVWMMSDASLDEAKAIVPLLSLLYELWPECLAKMIAGDSAWDEDWACRLCEVDYGIHPIFRLHDEGAPKAVNGFSRDGSIVAHTSTGQLICAKHRKDLAFKGAETPSRNGLRPGQTAKEGQFRLRAHCPDGCGSPSLRMAADWSALTYYPHHPVGKAAAERHAIRQAMLTRLNQIENIFERLQAGKKLGNEGADRTRLRDKEAHETLLSLGLMSMTAATLADQRG